MMYKCVIVGNRSRKNAEIRERDNSIAISPIISKVFEYCFLDRFGSLLSSSDNQFGFKKDSGCRNAIYTFRKVVDSYVTRGTTVNICSIDLSKAFDNVNHYACSLN